jgi:hypothetical protein
MSILSLVRGAKKWYLQGELKLVSALSQSPLESTTNSASTTLPTLSEPSPVLKAVDPTWPVHQLTSLEFELCEKAYKMGGAAWMAPYPHAYEDSPEQQVELGQVCMALESLCRHGLAVEISHASPYKEAVAEAAGNGRTIRYFAFSQRGHALFDIDPERKPQ